MDAGTFCAMIRSAILAFEPRIIPSSLRVVPVDGAMAGDLREVGFMIEGNIWCEPVPERFQMQAHIDAASCEWSFDS
jgi:predicted component of type VI protein secretion system